jgi:hypothetical protein
MALSNLFRPSDWTSGQRDIKGLFGTGLSPLSGDQLTKDIGALRTEAGAGVLRRFPTQGAKQNPVEYLRIKAQEIAPYDPTYAQELMDKANQMEMQQKSVAINEQKASTQQDLVGARLGAEEQKNIAKQNAISAVSSATEKWAMGKDDPALRNELQTAINSAKALGVSVENPIDDYLREKQNEATLGQGQQRIELAKEETEADKLNREQSQQNWNKTYELQAQNVANDNALKWKTYQLALDNANKQAVSSTKTMTEGQSNAMGFAKRMGESVNIIKELAPKLSRTELALIQAGDVASSLSPDARRYKLALDDFIRAQLRKESGAAIGKDEFAGAFSQYGFSPLDNDAIKADKMNRLLDGAENMKASAGTAGKAIIEGKLEPQQQTGRKVVTDANAFFGGK